MLAGCEGWQYLVVQGTVLCMEAGGAVVAQLRRGTLQYCVLALLSAREHYGFELVRTLSDTDGMVTSEGTVYPLLARLKKGGWVSTTWRDSPSGPPRKYYAITAAGRRALESFRDDWQRFQSAVNSLLEEGTRR
jgi:PadR family transcriptional regulator, regulatory protein PadR